MAVRHEVLSYGSQAYRRDACLVVIAGVSALSLLGSRFVLARVPVGSGSSTILARGFGRRRIGAALVGSYSMAVARGLVSSQAYQRDSCQIQAAVRCERLVAIVGRS